VHDSGKKKRMVLCMPLAGSAGQESTRPMFRESAMKHRTAPARLEELLPVTPPRAWISLIGFGILLSALLAWSIKGRVPERAEGHAVILRAGGVQSVIAPSAGILIGINAAPGARLQPKQVVARIGQPVLAERMRAAESALEAARAERDRAVAVRRQAAGLEAASVERQRESVLREIADYQERARLADEELQAERELFRHGIVTKLKVIAAEQKRKDIDTAINKMRAQLVQLDAQRYSIDASPAQVAADNDAKVREAERQLADVRKQLNVAEAVITPYGGQVVEVKTYPGAGIGLGAPILSLQPDNTALEAIAYVPSTVAKDVRPGLAVELSPGNLKPEEFGYLKGTVRFVAEYPATRAALMRNFENEALVDSLSRSGPVTEVRVGLESEESTPSGFRWSTSKGPAMRITAGTLAAARIVTRTQRPISLVLPWVKAKAGW
jgi:HlyD family secretion protein